MNKEKMVKQTVPARWRGKGTENDYGTDKMY
jgi:hypothetical protein